MSTSAIFGIVKTDDQARSAVAQLQTVGFLPSDISVLSRSADNRSEVVQENISALDSTASDISSESRNVGHTNSTKAPEGATTGGVTGGVLGGIAGWLVGIGALAIPGVGPFVAAGPILAALSGAAIGATAGGVTGALVGYGIPEYEAKLYSGRLEEGHILIGVHAATSEEADAAKTALAAVGAEDIKTTSEVALH